jgi:hypothetical protein
MCRRELITGGNYFILQAAADYTLCGVQHARPVNLCLKCRSPYLKVIEKFSEMGNFSQVIVTPNNLFCYYSIFVVG